MCPRCHATGMAAPEGHRHLFDVVLFICDAGKKHEERDFVKIYLRHLFETMRRLADVFNLVAGQICNSFGLAKPFE